MNLPMLDKLVPILQNSSLMEEKIAEVEVIRALVERLIIPHNQNLTICEDLNLLAPTSPHLHNNSQSLTMYKDLN